MKTGPLSPTADLVTSCPDKPNVLGPRPMGGFIIERSWVRIPPVARLLLFSPHSVSLNRAIVGRARAGEIRLIKLEKLDAVRINYQPMVLCRALKLGIWWQCHIL